MLKIAKWFNNYQTPAVLMIDDLSDAYVGVYEESYKNDWGYLCNEEGSSFRFLQKELLVTFPYIKITFFVPYLKHNVINNNSRFEIKKYALGDRSEYAAFLKQLHETGHEIAHHGSSHGKYINEMIPTTVNNWIHEWALFDSVDAGVTTTLNGVKKFEEVCGINVVGGKYCGYTAIENSQEIIDKCGFLYWCEKVNYNVGDNEVNFFGKNNVISFPTTFSGNAFVRLSYLTGNPKKDKKKKISKYFQPIYNIYGYIKLLKLYHNSHIISIQQHISPSTTSGTVQSANIITDIKSLKRIYGILNKLSIWYATAKEISQYIYVRENCKLSMKDDYVIIEFLNYRNLADTKISIINNKRFSFIKGKDHLHANENNGMYVLNIEIENGENRFEIVS